jgi:hypothetical protein
MEQIHFPARLPHAYIPVAGKDFGAMDWLNRFPLVRRATPVFRGASRAAAVRELSGRCSAAVWDRIQPRVLEMSLSEARGYIRAKATEVLGAKAQAVLGAKGPSGVRSAVRRGPLEHPDDRRLVLAGATEAIVEKVIAEVRRIQMSSRVRRHAA